MIACRARLANVFSDPLKGFSGKGSARNCFELILKLGLPTQKKPSLILTELPAVLQPRRASQLPPAGKIHSGPFHHHGSPRSWRTTEKAIGFPTSPSQVLHFLIQQANALLTDVTKYTVWGGKSPQKKNQHSSFALKFHGKQVLCVPHLQLHCRGAEKASTSILCSAGCCGTPGINLCYLLGWHCSLCPTVTSVPAHGSRR